MSIKISIQRKFSLNNNIDDIIYGPKLLKDFSYIKGRNKVLGLVPSRLFLINRRGAAEARGAHNSEDTRSKRVAGIFPIWHV